MQGLPWNLILILWDGGTKQISYFRTGWKDCWIRICSTGDNCSSRTDWTSFSIVKYIGYQWRFSCCSDLNLRITGDRTAKREFWIELVVFFADFRSSLYRNLQYANTSATITWATEGLHGLRQLTKNWKFAVWYGRWMENVKNRERSFN